MTLPITTLKRLVSPSASLSLAGGHHQGSGGRHVMRQLQGLLPRIRAPSLAVSYDVITRSDGKIGIPSQVEENAGSILEMSNVGGSD